MQEEWITDHAPVSLYDIYGQTDVVQMLKMSLQNEQISNMLFYGRPSTGKTSTILALCREYYGDSFFDCVLDLNSVYDIGINIVRNDIKNFASTKSYTGKKKIILIDVDNITIDAQYALRRIIEKYSNNARFVLICINLHKIIPSIYSRCVIIKFTSLNTCDAIRLFDTILEPHGCCIGADVGQLLYETSNRDIRMCINFIQCVSNVKSVVEDDDVLLHFYAIDRIRFDKIKGMIFANTTDNREWYDTIVQTWDPVVHMTIIFKVLFVLLVEAGRSDTIQLLSDVEYKFVTSGYKCPYMCIHIISVILEPI